MKSEELADIERGASNYPMVSSEAVKRLIAEIRRLQAELEKSKRGESAQA